MSGSASRPGRAAFVLALILVAILVAVDLSSQRSILRGLWQAAFPHSTRGEHMRDNLIEGIKGRR